VRRDGENRDDGPRWKAIASPRWAAVCHHRPRAGSPGVLGAWIRPPRSGAGRSQARGGGRRRAGCRPGRYSRSAATGEARWAWAEADPRYHRRPVLRGGASGRAGRGTRRVRRRVRRDAAYDRREGRCGAARSARRLVNVRRAGRRNGPETLGRRFRSRDGSPGAEAGKAPRRPVGRDAAAPGTGSGPIAAGRRPEAKHPRPSAPRSVRVVAARNSVGRLRRVEWETSPEGSMGTRGGLYLGEATRIKRVQGSTERTRVPERGRESESPSLRRDLPGGWASRPALPFGSYQSALGFSVQVLLPVHGHAWTKATPPGEGGSRRLAGLARSVL
jgi:hypothetical protein